MVNDERPQHPTREGTRHQAHNQYLKGADPTVLCQRSRDHRLIVPASGTAITSQTAVSRGQSQNENYCPMWVGVTATRRGLKPGAWAFFPVQLGRFGARAESSDLPRGPLPHPTDEPSR